MSTNPSQSDNKTTTESEPADSRSSIMKGVNAIWTRLPFVSSESKTAITSEFSSALKRIITPDQIEWHDEYAKFGDIYSRTYYIATWPKEAQAHLLYQLYANPQLVFDVSLHYNPLSRETATAELVDLEETLKDKVGGEFSHLLPNVEAHKQTLSKVREMKVSVENDGHRLHELSIYLTVYTTNQENLAKIDRLVQQDIREGGGRFGLSIERDLPDLAHLSTAPLAKNALDSCRRRSSQLLLDTAAATTFPLVDDTLIEESGVVVGHNLANDTAIVLDIYERNNGYLKLVLGDLGSGKSFGEKQYLLRHRHRHPDDNIVIIDPMSGFEGVNEAIGGEHVRVDGTETINPLEIQPTPEHVLNSSEQLDPYRMKLDEVRWFFKRYFDAYLEDESVVDNLWAPLMRAVRKGFRDQGITNDPATHDNPSPTIQDVLKNLEYIADNPGEYAYSGSQREGTNWEDRAVDLIMHLEPFREGNALDNLVGQTSLEISSEKPTYIDLEAYEGGSQGMQSLMMKLVFSMVYEQIKQTDKRTIVAIDEAHKIIDEGEEADHWEERARHSRHHDLSLHLISQEFEDFFQSEEGDEANEAAKSMANLSTIQQIHRVNNVNRELAKDGLGLTDDHIDFIESAVPGEDDNRPYTTALLKVADKGHYGLKTVATETEQDLIDFEPDDLLDDTKTVGNDRIEHTLKLKRGVDLDTDERKALSDDELQTLVQRLPIDQLREDVIEKFIDRLIESDDTPYADGDREFLEHVLYGDGDLTEVASNLTEPDSNQEASNRWADSSRASADSNTPSSTTNEQPVDEPVDPTPAPQSESASSLQPTDEDTTAQSGLPTAPPDTPEGIDLASPAMNAPSGDYTTSGQSPAPSPESSKIDLTEEMADSISSTLPSVANATIDVSDPISMEKRKECHYIVLDELSETQLKALIQCYRLPSDLSGDAIKTEIVQTHADNETASGGADADVNPIAHIKDRLPTAANTPSPSGGGEDTTPDSSPTLPGEIQSLDKQVPVNKPITMEKRVECHHTVLSELSAETTDRLLSTDCPTVDWTAASDASTRELAEAYAAHEDDENGASADINVGKLLVTHYTVAESDTSS